MHLPVSGVCTPCTETTARMAVVGCPKGRTILARGGVYALHRNCTETKAPDHAVDRSGLTARGTPIDPNNLLPPAIAPGNSLTLITHNTVEFSRVVGLTLDDWQV